MQKLSANFIIVEDQRVDKQKEGQPEAETSKRIRLPGSQTEVRWFCGSSKERAAWSEQTSKPAKGLLRSDGTIQWNVYECTDLSGPSKAVGKCAVPETTEFCPKFDGANSSAWVFELKKSTWNVNSKTATISVDGKIRVEVEKEAGPLTAKGSTYESRHFLVIPPGYSFFAFTNNTSVPDVHAATGFGWRCSASPEYIQAHWRCSSLKICDVGVCGQTHSGSVRIHVTFALLMFCLTAVFLVH